MVPFVAVDIGNSRLKFGLFDGACAQRVPAPVRSLDLTPDRESLDCLADWLAPRAVPDVSWWIASVNRPHATRLLDWLRTRHEGLHITLLSSGDLPLEVRLPRPDMVGI